MNKKVILCLIFLLVFPFILAACGDGQIDINSASTLELEYLNGIGPVYAGRIVELRPYTSIDELIDVSGIGPVTLNKIKTQGLACVADSETPIEQEEIVEEIEEAITHKSLDEFNDEDGEIVETKVEKKPIKIEKEVIDLSPQTIKSENDTSKLSNKDYAKYGLVLFSILLGGLFFVRHKRLEKNEFR